MNLPILVAGGAAGRMQGRPPHPLREADAAGQPAPDAARQGRRPPRLVRRQQGQGRRAVRAALSGDHDSAMRATCVAVAAIVAAAARRPRRRAAPTPPLADAAEKHGSRAGPRAARAARRCQRAAGRRHDGAALGGVSRRPARRRSCCSRAGANVKAANRYGVTPLSLACTNGNAAIVELLLEGRRRSERGAARRRDAPDDRRAHRQRSGR